MAPGRAGGGWWLFASQSDRHDGSTRVQGLPVLVDGDTGYGEALNAALIGSVLPDAADRSPG